MVFAYFNGNKMGKKIALFKRNTQLHYIIIVRVKTKNVQVQQLTLGTSG
jgi:hypothetical protein